MSDPIIISEFLFVLQNKYGNIPNFNLQNMLVAFYNEDEVRASKTIVFDVAKTLMDENEVGRFVKRQGDDRKKLDVADIMQIFDLLDKKKAKLPMFVAANMNRIPGLKPLDGEVVTLTANVNDLKTQVQQLTVSINALQTKINGKPEDLKSSVNKEFFPEISGHQLVVNLENKKSSSVLVSNNDQGSGKGMQCGGVDMAPSVMASSSDNTQPWTRVGRNGKPDLPAPSRVNYDGFRESKPLYGSKVVGDSKVRAVTEVRTWHCKIGRLRSDVTENDIKNYLQDHGICPLKVEQLKSRQGSSVTMHVEVPFDYKDVVMDSDFWYKGIRVSGWRFRYNNRHNNHRDDKYYGYNWEEW